MSRILITNDGPHPPEKWAMVTAETIFDISGVAQQDRMIQARKLQIAIAEALMPHHAEAQQTERTKLASDPQHIHSEFDREVDAALADIMAAARRSPWEEHFANPEWQAAVREIVMNHLHTARHIERLYHADRNPDCEISQHYKAKFQG